MSILIVGSDSNAYSLAKYFRQKNPDEMIFVASGTEKTSDYAENVDISENDTEELVEFAKANEIALTVVTSLMAIQNDIAEAFNKAELPILAPTADAATVAIYKSAAKKTMYRLQIPTMKFGIFERENQAVAYASNARKALVIKQDTHIPGDRPYFATSFAKAKTAIEKAAISPENKIIIEDYIDAKEVSLYFLTDGYSVFPIGSCMSNEDFSYPLTVFYPDNCISKELEEKILKETVYPLIDDISERAGVYCGILGIDIFVKDDIYNVIEFNPFFKKMHLQAILPVIKTDLYGLFLSAVYGSLSDEYSLVEFDNGHTFSHIVEKISDEALKALDDDDLDVSYTGMSHVILTQKAKTLKRAKETLLENIEFLKDYEAENEQ